MKTIEEKNRMIAEFMGFKMINNLQISTPNGGGAFLNELKYHTSWDWLMPVVDSIYNTGMDEQTTNEIGDVTHALLDINIQSTHDAVISFIEFYNQNK